MGYEVKLLIGQTHEEETDYKKADKPVIDNNALYWPYLEDEKGEWIPSGRTKTWFSLMATLDLCKIGDGPLSKLVEKAKIKAKKPKHFYYVYLDGNTEEEEDCYGDHFKPVEIAEVIKALEQEQALEASKGENRYRRFVWALGLLKAIQSQDGEHVKVLFYGH